MATEKSAATGRAVRGQAGNGPLQRARKYLGEVMTELKKTTWPTRPELIAQTQVVLGLLIVLGVFMAAWDFLLAQIFNVILRVLGVQR